MFDSRRSEERGAAVVEVLLWLTTIAAVLGVGSYVGLRAWADREPDLTSEQQAYVRAVATQQAAAYVSAIATQQAEAPLPAVEAPPADRDTITAPAPRPVATRPAVPAAPPPAQDQPEQPAPPQAPAPPPAPPPAPLAPAAMPAIAACVGYMVGSTSTGADQCREVIAAPDTHRDVAACIGHVLAGTQNSDAGGNACTQAALHTRDAFLQDCFMGLAGLSHFGRRACVQYYDRFAS